MFHTVFYFPFYLYLCVLVSIVNVQFVIDPSQAIIQLKKYQTPMLSFELLDLSYVCLRVVTKYPVTSILNVFICIYMLLTRITHKPECCEIKIKGSIL